MTDAIDVLSAWLDKIPDTDTFKKFRGLWMADTSNKTERILAFMQTGGGGPRVTTRTQTVRVTFLSAENGRSDIVPLSEYVAKVLDLLESDYKACGVAQILLIGGIIGPGLTAENRAWYELNFQLII